MKICLIGPTYPYRGGISHHTTFLADALRKQHEVLFISFSRQYPSILFPGTDDKDPAADYVDGVEYILDSVNPITWWQVVRRVAAWQPDVVIMPWWNKYWTACWSFIGSQVKRLSNRPKLIHTCLVVNAHEPSRFDTFAIRFVLQRADVLIAHSPVEGDYLRTLFPNTMLRVTPHPTYANLGEHDETPEEAPLPFEKKPGTHLMIFAGFVRPYKGLDVLIEALPDVVNEIDTHLLIAGEFWNGREETDAQIARLNVGEHVTIVDSYIPDDVFTSYIRQADVSILPYRSATPSGIVQLSFGHGTPVITTDVGDLATTVTNNVTGLVVAPEDPQALAAAIKRYFQEGLRQSFVQNIENEASRFSWGKLTDEIEAAVAELA